MLGIQEVGSYIPKKRISNYFKKDKFDITEEFILKKIGIESVSVKDTSEDTSDLCVQAYKQLKEKVNIKNEDIEVIIVVTQNPDYTLPQSSAIVHGKLGLNNSCASFDISLGCSGFVYALSVIQSFMICNKMKKGLLFTSDPYSKIIDPDDKNTSLLFGDGAAVTLISDKPVFSTIGFSYGTIGTSYKELLCENNILYMNGRAISSFAMKVIPKDIINLLAKHKLSLNDIDKYLFHQGSKFIVDSLAKRLELNEKKIVFDIYNYGNTVSSSLPILLEKQISQKRNKLLLISGFGVGLSWANAILKRVITDNKRKV